MIFLKKIFRLRIRIVFLLVLLSTGCSSLPTITHEPTYPALPTPSMTRMISLTPVSTQTASVTPSPSATLTPALPTLTMTPTPSPVLPTPTRLPTLPAEEAEQEIIDLLLHNAGCKLPCWWGITPGETSLQTARSSLETFEALAILNIFDQDGGSASWFVTENDLILDTIVSLVSDQETMATIEGLEVVMQVKRRLLDEGGFEVVWDNPLNDRYLRAYMLPQILTTYGSPDEVLVQANEGWRVFDLILDYASRGFAIWYTALLDHVGDNYQGCMANAYMHLALWDADLGYTWAEGVTRTSSGEEWEIEALNEIFQSLKKATSLSPDEFYQTFANPENTTCLETPVEIWPGP